MSFDYYEGLDTVSRSRYDEKISLIGLNECPYKLPAGSWENNPLRWPNLHLGNVFTYLLKTPGVFTGETMDNYKSLEAYNYFISGWVETIFHYNPATGSHIIMKAQVRPSQRLNDKKHTPWVALCKDGRVAAAHCDCMAGLAESCSHVAAVLFKVEAAVKLGYTTKACTELPCAWNNDYVKKVGPDPVAKINFFSEKRKRKAANRSNKKKQVFSASTSEQQEQFLNSIKQLEKKPLVLSCFNGYSEDFHWKKAPKRNPKIPPPLSSLYTVENEKLTDDELHKKCETVLRTMKLSEEEVDFVARSTKGQKDNLLWHQQRVGRITSSTVHAVIRTDTDNPSKSVVESVCYPRKHPIKSEAIMWGNDNEAKALKAYKDVMKSSVSSHNNFAVEQDGLYLSKDKPFIGASADAIMTCDCHGKRVVEVKCPFSARNDDFQTFLQKPDCYIQDTKLKKTHKYYSQVQLQMFVYSVNQCDFVVWAPKFLVVIHVPRDDDFITEMLEKCEFMFLKHFLPQLISRKHGYMTTKSVAAPDERGKENIFCLCQQPEDDRKYIGCDNPKCPVQWYHLDCLKLKREPKGTWLCQQCKNRSKC